MKRLNLLVVAVGVLIALGITGIVLDRVRLENQQAETNRQLERFDERVRTLLAGVCALRREREQGIDPIERQIEQMKTYLREHPDGIPGVASRQDLTNSLKAQETNLEIQRDTVRTLVVVDCVKGTG